MEAESELTPPRTPETANFIPNVYEPKKSEKHLFICVPENNWIEDTVEKLSELQNSHEIPQNSPLYLVKRYFTRTAISEDPSVLFDLLRLNISVVTTSILYSSGSQMSVITECLNSRLDIASALSCVRSELHHLRNGILIKDKESIVKNCSSILSEIKKTLMLVGRISDISDYAVQLKYATDSQTDTLPSHVFHLYLELWWSAVNMTSVLLGGDAWKTCSFQVSFCSEDVSGGGNLFVQVANLFMWDLCCLAAKCYDRVALLDVNKISPFSCTCVKQSWAMLYMLFREHQNEDGEDTFWICLHQIFEYALENQNTDVKNSKNYKLNEFTLIPKSFSCSQPALFALWLLSHLAELITVVSQEIIITAKPSSSYKEAKKLVSCILNYQDEAAVRVMLKCCISLCPIWDPSIELLLPLTDYFLKQLNDNFQLTKPSVQNLLTICDSGSRLLNQVKEKIDGCYIWKATDTSFQMYLRLLALSIKRFHEAGATHLWRQLKGRIYSKFHLRRIEELTEHGLQNCFSLFLALALSGDIEDVVKKMLDLFEMLRSACLSSKKLCVGLKAMFGVILEYQNRGLNFGHIGSKISEWFTSLCLEKSGQSVDGQFFQRRSALLKVYLEDLEHVFESGSDLSLSEESLLHPDFSSVLAQCSPLEQSTVLITAQHIVSALRSAHKKYEPKDFCFDASLKASYENLSNTLYTIFLPYLYKASSGSHSVAQLADTAIEFTLLSMILPSSVPLTVKATFQNLFEQFGCSVHTNPRLSCRYLCHIVDNHDAFDKLKIFVPDYPGRLFKASLRCALNVPPPCEQTLKLLGTVLTLKEVTSLFCTVCDTKPDSHGDLLAEYFHSVGKTYENLVSSNNISKITGLRQNFQRYLQDYLSVAETVVKTPLPLNLFRHIYKVTGHLISSCSPLLYIKGKARCLFPQLIDCLILPASLYKDKSLPQNQMMAIKETLPSYIEALLSLNIQQDPYLQRMLKSIVLIYLPMFTIKQHTLFSSGEHPLLVCIRPEQGVFKGQKLDNALKFIAEAVCENFLSRKGPGFSHLSQALVFTQEILKMIKPHQHLFLIPIVLPVISDLCITNDHNKQVQDLFEMLLLMAKQSFETEARRQYLVPVVKSFSEHHIAWAASSAFGILTKMLKLYPELVADSLMVITSIVKKTEDMRGVGHDRILRKGLTELVSHVERLRDATGSKNSVS